MATLKPLVDKLKGKGRQTKGEFHSKTGDKPRGAFEKFLGKAEETYADIRMNKRNKKTPKKVL
jgi:uncharacterized protein YjbJ (UPF0337 family)